MSDSASDPPEAIITSPEIRNPFGQPHLREPAPTLVPSARPGSEHQVLSLLQQATAGIKANLKYAAHHAHKTSSGPGNPQDGPKELTADVGPGDRSQDTLKLLQELAWMINADSSPRRMPAEQIDTTLPSYLAIVGMIDELNAAERDKKLQLLARVDNNPKLAQFAIAGCSAILALSMIGLFIWSRAIPAQDSQPRTEPEITVAAPSEVSAIPAEPVRPDIPSVQTAMAECDLAASKNPFAVYFLMPPNALSPNIRPEPQLSGEDYGWYSLMSLKAKLERRGACTVVPY